MNLNKLAFVDLETTGANPVKDRITEFGLLIVEGDSVTRWGSLINPGCRIPPFMRRSRMNIGAGEGIQPLRIPIP